MNYPKTILFIGIVLIMLIMLSGCNKKADQKVDDAQENMVEAEQDLKEATAESEAVKTWQEYKDQANARMAANDKIIADYKADMVGTNGKLKAAYNKEIESLEKSNKELRSKLNNFKDDGKNSWEKFKAELDGDMDKLGSALKGFVVNSK
ncbi:MAG: hypothetical protein PHO32_05230 [Candidatus Cloacimonetes bacterium]|nr:hypothetical protein [Candidatus Cloacimonadota bacterium]